MQENFPQHNDPEKLREENEFLKLKLMLEHGADLGGNNESELPAEIEHMFLTNVLAFEKQFEERKTITVFDKIGRPLHFKPVVEIKDDEIGQAWNELRDYLNKYGIDLGACSPNVTERELYRFTLEELFLHEMDDISLPGWVTHFFYDEFHPDSVYDNTQVAVDYCLKMIFRKEPLEWLHHFTENNIRLNGHFPLNRQKFQQLINQFKECYDDIRLTGNYNTTSTLTENRCQVSGNYEVEADCSNDKIFFRGSWKTVFEKNKELGYWDINDVQVEGIPF